MTESAKCRRRNEEIDRLRGVAILFTLLAHFQNLFPFDVYVPYRFGNSFTGVNLFFVISGYVVSKTFLPRLDIAILGKEEGAVWRELKAFWCRRVFRIFPVIALWIAIRVLFSVVLPNSNTIGPFDDLIHESLYVFLCIYNLFEAFGGTRYLGSYWSLSLEEQFYFVFPFLAVAVFSHRSRVLILTSACAFIILISRPFLIPSGVQEFPFVRTLPFYNFDFIILGCLIYLGSLSGWKSRLDVDLGAIGNNVLSLLLIYFLAIIPRKVDHLITVGYPLILLVSGVLVSRAVASRNLILNVPGLRNVLGWLGTRSYGIYVIQQLSFAMVKDGLSIFWFTPKNLQPNSGYFWLYFVLGFSILFIATELSFRFFELPFINFGRKISRRIEAGS